MANIQHIMELSTFAVSIWNFQTIYKMDESKLNDTLTPEDNKKP